MDYEKAYKEALERARKLTSDMTTLQKIREFIFPELRESEDERKRKEIISYLDFAESHNLLRAADYEKKKGWLAYLEKQKECLADNSKTSASEDERIRRTLAEYFGPEVQLDLVRGVPIQKIRDWLEKQKDSKWSPSEDEMGVLYKLCYISNQVTDEDDTELTRLYQDLKREYFNGHSFENMFPSEKQKEPHYTKRNALFDKCVENCDPATMKKVSDEVDEMLGKVQKPAEWSPTHEQMVALNWAANGIDNNSPCAGDIKASLRSLYNDLQSKSIRPAEWSEEEKNKVVRYLHDRDGGMLWSKATEITGDILDMLRPLGNQARSRCRCFLR